MSRPHFIVIEGKEGLLGNSFWGGRERNRCFGFAPIEVPVTQGSLPPEVLPLAPRVRRAENGSWQCIPPGERGYGKAMFEYWRARVEEIGPEKVKVRDIYGYEMSWSEFERGLETGKVTLTDEFIGEILVGIGVGRNR